MSFGETYTSHARAEISWNHRQDLQGHAQMIPRSGAFMVTREGSRTQPCFAEGIQRIRSLEEWCGNADTPKHICCSCWRLLVGKFELVSWHWFFDPPLGGVRWKRCFTHKYFKTMPLIFACRRISPVGQVHFHGRDTWRPLVLDTDVKKLSRSQVFSNIP